MGIADAAARLLAAYARKRGRPDRVLAWYGRIGRERLRTEERIEYAELLQDNEQHERALEALAGLEHPEAFARRALIYGELDQSERAIEQLGEAIRLDPSPSRYWHSRAVAYSGLDKLDEAIADMGEAIARSDGAGRCSSFYELGCLYLRAERFEEAAAAFETACKSREYAIPLYWFRYGQALEETGRDPEAIRAVSRAADGQSRLRSMEDKGVAYMRERTAYSGTAVRTLLAIIESEAGFRLKEAQLLEKAGRREDAFAAVEKGLRDYPGDVELRLRRGALLREDGRLEEAAAELVAVHSEFPDRLGAYMELCAVYRKQEKWLEAIEVLKDAIARYPHQTVARFWLADVYREAEMRAEAWEASAELVAMEPEDPLNWRQRAELAIDAKRYDEADEAYTRAIGLDEGAEYYLRRSYSRFMAERYEEAMMDIQQALERDESLREESKTAYAMAELYMGMGNRELAEAEYGHAIELEPGSPQLYERRAQCRFELERYDDALEDCRAGLARDPENVRLLWLRSYIHWRQGDLDSAVHDTKDYIRLVPEDYQGHYNLAMIYSRQGQHDDALSSLNRALEHSPFEPRLYKERASLYYHHLFDRTRAAEDLAQWLLYTGTERPENDRLARLGELDGFDDEMRELAKTKFLGGFGMSRYLS